MSETKSHAWSTRYIDKHFGSYRNPLSKWLRQQLLIVTDEFYRYDSNENKCKEYCLNGDGVRNLLEMMKINIPHTYPSVVEVVKLEHLDELTTGKFEYADKSNRLWHPLQRYRRQYKTQILAEHGYQHQYDIECCAPTLIHQYAQHCGMDEWLFALRKYLDDRQTIRQELAEQIELPVEAVKEIINAMFAGAVISKNNECDIFKILNGDVARIEFLQQHEFINQLKQDIKTCWVYITPRLSRRRNTKTNRLLPVNSRQKWGVYFDLERRVLNSVRTYLDEKNYKYFLEHDGWSCDTEIDRDELSNFVRDKTGFMIKIEHDEINILHTYPSVVEVAKTGETNDL